MLQSGKPNSASANDAVALSIGSPVKEALLRK
jgi:hypothetical protein